MCYSGTCSHERPNGECKGNYIQCPMTIESNSDLQDIQDKLDDMADRLYDEYKTGDRSWSSARSQFSHYKKKIHI